MGTPTKKQDSREWSKTTFGDSLLCSEQIEMNDILPKFLGNYLVKLGGPKQNIFLQTSPIRQKIYLTSNSQNINPDINNYSNYDNNFNFAITNVIQCDYAALPLLCESIDVAIIHHALEFAKNPRAILEEVAQALTPQGHLIIIGFNPNSLFGLQHYFFKNNHDPSTKSFKRARFISAKRITRWLEQLNFVFNDYFTCHFRPYTQHATILHALQPLEKIGKCLHIPCGASYIFVAEKKALGITPLKNGSLAKQLSFGYLKPSPQTHNSQAHD